MGYYIVRYRGPFGFIKPWCAVRDSKTFSQQFLTPSIIEGIRQKLEVAVVLRHKLTYDAISVQQERTQTRGWKIKKTQKLMVREQSILDRGVMVAGDIRPEDLPGYSRIRLFNAMIEFGEIDLPVDKIVL